MSKEVVENTDYIHDDDLGQVRLADQVIAVCAVNAVMKVQGVAGLSGGLTDSLQESLLRKESLTKGIKVDQSDDGIVLDVFVVIEYGVKIPQVAWEIQKAVKKELETMTDRPVAQVNIHVQGVVEKKGE